MVSQFLDLKSGMGHSIQMIFDHDLHVEMNIEVNVKASPNFFLLEQIFFSLSRYSCNFMPSVWNGVCETAILGLRWDLEGSRTPRTKISRSAPPTSL